MTYEREPCGRGVLPSVVLSVRRGVIAAFRSANRIRRSLLCVLGSSRVQVHGVRTEFALVSDGHVGAGFFTPWRLTRESCSLEHSAILGVNSVWARIAVLRISHCLYFLRRWWTNPVRPGFQSLYTCREDAPSFRRRFARSSSSFRCPPSIRPRRRDSSRRRLRLARCFAFL